MKHINATNLKRNPGKPRDLQCARIPHKGLGSVSSPTESSSCLPRPAVGELVTFRSFRVFCKRPDVFDPHHGIVILSEAPRRLSLNTGLTARSRRTPAMLIGRCSSQLSGHRKLKKVKASERSAALIYSLTQRLWRGVEGPRRCFSFPCCLEVLNHRSLRQAEILRATRWSRCSI
jgi:hypothetical protein